MTSSSLHEQDALRFTVALPFGNILSGQFQTPGAVREIAQALEAAGADAGYVTDHPAPSADWLHGHAGLGHDALDPFTTLGFVAASTERLIVHTNIVVLSYRNPFITAKAAATVQQLSSGRLILGVAAGYQKAEFDALGVDFHARGALTDQALKVIRAVWAGDPVTYESPTINAVNIQARPVPTPTPPIWIGGGSDAAVRRAARAGDGWCPVLADERQSEVTRSTAVRSASDLRTKVREIQERRSELGRTGKFDVMVATRFGPSPDEPGSVERYLETVLELADAGATWIGIHPPYGDRQSYLDYVAWYGQEIIEIARREFRPS